MGQIIPDVVAGDAVPAISVEATAADAAQLIAGFERWGAVVVVDDNGAVVGCVSEREICRAVVARGLDAARIGIAEIMNREPDVLAPDDSAFEALELMAARGYRPLPVVDAGRLVGLVTVEHLAAAARLEILRVIKEAEARLFSGG